MKKRILVIEDDELLVRLLVERLSQHFDAQGAEDGEKAWDMLNKNVYDAVILDLFIPMINGYVLLEQIRSSENPKLAKIPVVILSNLGSQESIQRAKDLGISDYLLKSSVDVEAIVERIKQAVNLQ